MMCCFEDLMMGWWIDSEIWRWGFGDGRSYIITLRQKTVYSWS